MPLFILPAIYWIKDNWSKMIAPICAAICIFGLIGLVSKCENYIKENQVLQTENATYKLAQNKQNNITNNFTQEVGKKEQKQKNIEQKIAKESQKIYLIHRILDIINCEYQNFNNLENECN